MHSSIALSALTLIVVTGSAVATTITVNVGKTGLVFNPDALTAAVGDVIKFYFFSSAHTVVQGDFNTPCARGSLESTGFNSGLINNNTNGGGYVFLVTVNSTNPMWFYCSTPSHCQSGMAGVINPPAFGNTLDNYKAAAAGISTSEGSSIVQGGVVLPVSIAVITNSPFRTDFPSTNDSPSTTDSPSTSISYAASTSSSVPAPSSSASASSSALASSVVQTSSAATPASSQSATLAASSSLSTGAQVGMGVGVAIAVLLIASGIFIYIRHLRKALQEAKAATASAYDVKFHKAELSAEEKRPTEMDGLGEVIYELGSNEEARFEMAEI